MNESQIEKKKMLGLRRGIYVLLLIAADLYFILSPYEGEKTSFFWLIVVGAAGGYFVYRLINNAMKKNEGTDDDDSHVNWLAVIAGCLCFVPFSILAFTPWGNVVGFIAILIVINAIALYFIFTCK